MRADSATAASVSLRNTTTRISDNDAASTNGNNWMIYHNPTSGLFEIWGHDFDPSVGDFRCDVFTYYFDHNGHLKGLLAERLLNVPEYRARFADIMRTLADSFDGFQDIIATQFGYVHSMLRPVILMTPWYNTEYIHGGGVRNVNDFDSDSASKIQYFVDRDANVIQQLNGTMA